MHRSEYRRGRVWDDDVGKDGSIVVQLSEIVKRNNDVDDGTLLCLFCTTSGGTSVVVEIADYYNYFYVSAQTDDTMTTITTILKESASVKRYERCDKIYSFVGYNEKPIPRLFKVFMTRENAWREIVRDIANTNAQFKTYESGVSMETKFMIEKMLADRHGCA